MPDELYHRPVLCAEVIQYLAPQPHGIYVDATFGGGGHTRAILSAEPTCRVIACDWDERALDMNAPSVAADFPGRFTAVWTNFAQLKQHLKRLNVDRVQGILADFGTSQYQLKHAKGFSFDSDTDLDMRMSPAHHKVTAAHIVNHASEEELMHILWEYGEERDAREIARAIVQRRPIFTGRALATVVAEAVLRQKRSRGDRQRPGGGPHPATRTFQALRIVVNRELDNIRALLAATPGLVAPGGHLVCITFHSIEDRWVKQEWEAQRALWKPLHKRVITASAEELAENPSSRSAKLRAVERTEIPWDLKG